MLPKVGIIVVNWNQPALTVSTIKSIQNVNSPNFCYQILLVDNGSTDNSLEVFKREFDQSIIIIKSPKNLGYVGGFNLGIKETRQYHPDYFLLANNDITVDKNFLKNLVTFAQKNSQIGIIGPKIYFSPGHEYYHDRYQPNQKGKIIWSYGGKIDWNNIIGSNIGIDEYDHGQYHNINHDLDFVSGCVLLIKAEVFNKIGLLDNQYFMYLEDADLCQRAKSNGFKLAVIPNSIVWHLNAQSSGTGSGLHDYFLTRNRLLFASRYASLRTKAAIFRESVKILFGSKSKWQKTGVIDFYLQKFNRGSWQ